MFKDLIIYRIGHPMNTTNAALIAALEDAARAINSMKVEAETAALAKRMAKAAGKVSPSLMAQACYMLICTACIVKNPGGYADFLAREEAKRSQAKEGGA